ncbi:ATP-binding protein [Cellvibrio sp. QJXJ]|uniref:ATP-binding protein n=1 Tax=Cellvibrio sp. QJXJ TaxID=2964606 RepID=UPI0021C3C86B|nr:ATP-binding protein [Cellvibrio sp. QJXJ]UUA71345.1 ATP-binding protein [Cellvibrio sp. QJXJ]
MSSSEFSKKIEIQNTHLRLEKDLILNDSSRIKFDEVLAKVKFHKKIYIDWNFASVDPTGRAVILNFYGPPGTGKTMAADALAGTLSMSIIKVGIADIESKFMGETAKNISSLFEKAAATASVLFFDEADTLLGKRLSSVTQGVDNEVNSMRSTMLVELEKFDGIVVFATNFIKNYDSAFHSRISHSIEFSLPDFLGRKAIFDRFLIDQIPINSTRQEFLELAAQVSEGFSGREIRNCMRLALPKCLIEASENGLEPVLNIQHCINAAEEINAAKKNYVSSHKTAISKENADDFKKLLNIETIQE